MVQESSDSLADLITKVRFIYTQDIDFTLLDHENTTEIVRRLANAAYRFNLYAISDFGGRSGRERASGLVEQVIGAAFQTFGDEDPHPDTFERAAMILRGITQGHPFEDGNRTGFLMVIYYLEQVGYPAPEEFPEDEVVEFCLQISAGEIRNVQAMATKLAHFWGHSH